MVNILGEDEIQRLGVNGDKGGCVLMQVTIRAVEYLEIIHVTLS